MILSESLIGFDSPAVISRGRNGSDDDGNPVHQQEHEQDQDASGRHGLKRVVRILRVIVNLDRQGGKRSPGPRGV